MKLEEIAETENQRILAVLSTYMNEHDKWVYMEGYTDAVVYCHKLLKGKVYKGV